ncbi:MAG: putative maltokinase [Chloroflexota bacterium]
MFLNGEAKMALEAALPGYLLGRRWFGGKAKQIASVEIVEAMPLRYEADGAYIVIIQVNYRDGEPQRYVLPLAVDRDSDGVRQPGSVVTRVELADEHGEVEQTNLVDATFDTDFTLGLLDSVRSSLQLKTGSGEIRAWHRLPVQASDTSEGELKASVMGAEQSNTSIKYGDRYILKLFRRLEEGTSPELEFGRYLGRRGFANTPPLVGAIEYQVDSEEALTLAILQRFVRNEGDAWSFTLRALEGYYERVAQHQVDGSDQMKEGTQLLDAAGGEIAEGMPSAIGDYVDWARLLGRRTGELHVALGSATEDDAFEPKPFTRDYQDSLYTAMQDLTKQAFGMLRYKLGTLPAEARAEAVALMEKEGEVAARFEPLKERPIAALRTRCHGDYHLGQVLFTGDDFMIIDFEGEPVRSLAERRRMHSPLKDVAGMLRSYHYAAYFGLLEYMSGHGEMPVEETARLEAWARVWQLGVSAAYLGEYLATVQDAGIVPESRDDLQVVLDAHLLEKAVYELIYELNNRPDWVHIPLQGILQLVR